STNSPCFRFLAFTVSGLQVSTVRVAVCADQAETFAEFITNRGTKTVTISGSNVGTIVFTLILQAQAQTINQTEEVRVTIGQNASGTAGHEVIRVVSPGHT